MEASELRQFSVDELKGRVKQWREELFRSRFKTETNENRDTSVLRRLKRDIARGMTVLGEKNKGVEVPVKASAPVQDKPVKAKKPAEQNAAAAEGAEEKAPKAKKATKKTTKGSKE